MKTNSLKNCRLLLLRQQVDSKNLIQQVTNQQGTTYQWPALEIIENPIPHPEFNNSINKADIHIVISKPAAKFASIRLKQIKSTNIFSVGEGTARVLAEAGIDNVKFPTQASSEALLEMEGLQSVKTNRVWIYKGEKGRNHLETTLKQRGATVTNIKLYTRKANQMTLEQAEEIELFSPNCIQITSIATAQSLDNSNQRFKLFNKHQIPVLVVSERIERHLLKKGYKNILNTNSILEGETIAKLRQLQFKPTKG